MSTHTPGPWNIDGRDIEGPPQKDGRWLIAKIVSDEPTDSANARLIAAAPDLLEALYAALQGHKGWDDEARAAIAKAEAQS